MESHSRSPGQLGRGPFPHTYEMPAPPNTAPWPSPGTHGATHGATSVTHVPSGDAAHDSHSRGDTAWSSVGNLLGKVKLQIWCWCRSLVQLGAAPCMPALLLSSSSSSSSHCAFACPGSVPPAGPAAPWGDVAPPGMEWRFALNHILPLGESTGGPTPSHRCSSSSSAPAPAAAAQPPSASTAKTEAKPKDGIGVKWC